MGGKVGRTRTKGTPTPNFMSDRYLRNPPTHFPMKMYHPTWYFLLLDTAVAPSGSLQQGAYPGKETHRVVGGKLSRSGRGGRAIPEVYILGRVGAVSVQGRVLVTCFSQGGSRAALGAESRGVSSRDTSCD
eukprot:183518-Hanusia_phi.AAC.2